MQQSWIRQNRMTGEWVIFAPSRGKRPSDFAMEKGSAGGTAIPSRSETCPFCPGNEDQLPEIIDEHTTRNGQSWLTRVVPNKFPALTPENETGRHYQGPYIYAGGYGKHEIIIETPAHNKDIPDFEKDEAEALVECYISRYAELIESHANALVLIFRNHGRNAGTSLEHPHSQIIVTGIVPRTIRDKEEMAQRHYDETGRCLLCELTGYELQNRTRVVAENEHFVTFIPFAAEVPFEMRIVPKRHEGDFRNLQSEERRAFASMFQHVLQALREALLDPDYNFVINTAPRYKLDEPHAHWYLLIRPRLTTPAGFEIGSGISINPSVPEEDAQFMRKHTR
ncbi:MAG: galactose-1-phosphate uridylyltransferase [Synergistales bacterium]|nr:galactose-1-phosphate uridylyltransferase [Synergistales bacterium]